MVIFYLFIVYAAAIIFKVLIYGFVTLFVGWLIYRIYHHFKAKYVLDNINNIDKIEFIKPIRQYKTVYEETGYSHNWRYYTTNYKAKRVPKPLVYKGVAFLKNGKKIKFQIYENSEIYNKLMQK